MGRAFMPNSGLPWRRAVGNGSRFTLTPNATDAAGRFAVTLRKPGSVALGYAFLQPGPWGRFKGLPVRRDVVEGLIDQGITVLRYGGSMVNHAEYRWKKMIGPRDRRPTNPGCWYPYSSNGWGIVDFLDFCQAAGFLAIPAFNMDETPQDMADFVEYVNGPASSVWGRRGAADGHPGPYRLTHMELGNEERVDEHYYRRFKAMAEAIWAKDPQMILVVGDFAYQPIRDPDHVTGAASGITSLAGQRKILALAKQHDREVWFDLHVGTDGPRPDSTLDGMLSFATALDKLADGARHKVVVFEFNAGNHAQRRALANAHGDSDRRTRRAHARRHLGQRPAAGRPERQRLEPGPVVPQSVAGVAPAAGLRHADDLAELPAAAGARARFKARAAGSTSSPSEARTARRWYWAWSTAESGRCERRSGSRASRCRSRRRWWRSCRARWTRSTRRPLPDTSSPSEREWRHAASGGELTFAPRSFTVVRLE